MATITSPRTASPAPSNSHTTQITTSSPSSSARTSLDQARNVASNTSTAGGPKPPPAQRRNRAALRDYYNLKAKPQAPGNLHRTGSIASTHSDVSIATTTTTTLTSEQTSTTTSALTAQLDDPDFKAEEWVRTLLEKSSLRDILKTEATLVSEIRNLDGERKALVYDNYSKLIKAVGTIGEMQRSMNGPSGESDGVSKIIGAQLEGSKNGRGGLERVDELEAKMDGLRATARELASNEVGGDEKSRRERSQQRQEKETEKKKKDTVKWVLNAPKRLHTLVEAGKEEEAEKDWTIVQKHLDKWKGVKGVDEVRRACEDVMAGSDEEETADERKSGPG